MSAQDVVLSEAQRLDLGQLLGLEQAPPSAGCPAPRSGQHAASSRVRLLPPQLERSRRAHLALLSRVGPLALGLVQPFLFLLFLLLAPQLAFFLLDPASAASGTSSERRGTGLGGGPGLPGPG